jgi:uncharacterized membrane protein YciS (DUF1049 family)
MQLLIFLALLIAIAIVLFALQNSAIVTVSFLLFHYNGSLALILVLVFASGLLAGILISLPSLLRKNAEVREQKRRVRQLEQRMTGATASPPSGQHRSDTDSEESR